MLVTNSTSLVFHVMFHVFISLGCEVERASLLVLALDLSCICGQRMTGTGVILKAEVETGFGQNTCMWSGLPPSMVTGLQELMSPQKARLKCMAFSLPTLRSQIMSLLYFIKAITKICQGSGGEDIDSTTR